jgi:hypothetical protein
MDEYHLLQAYKRILRWSFQVASFQVHRAGCQPLHGIAAAV